MKIKNKKTIYLILFILIIFICATLSTYAYWTVRVVSSNSSVSTESKAVGFSMNINPLYVGENIIPMDNSDVLKAISNQCLDNNNKYACYAYTITLSDYSDTSSSISGFMDMTTNNISNLSYLLLIKDTTYNEDSCVTIDDNYYCIIEDITRIDSGDVIETTDETSSWGNLPLGGEFLTSEYDTLDLIIIIWLTNLEESQNNYDIGEFNATITFELGSGGKIEGNISNATNIENQTD